MNPPAPRELTFLLTDIVGSTRLWQEDERRMRLAVRQHDALATAAINAHDGHLVKHTGDGVFAVFAGVEQGLGAVLDLQRAFEGAEWPTASPIRVRAGLHRGVAELRDGDYYGPDVNRCARIQELAHGGQTLFSERAAEMARHLLPPDCSLRDMGRHSLRDFPHAERVYQLEAPGLPRDFPALRSAGAGATNLPNPLTCFIGREAELDRVRALVRGARMVTLLGPSGCGKTRLAIESAEGLRGAAFTDGIWFVDLSATSDPALVAQAVATALRLRETGGVPMARLVLGHLAKADALVILDNCEHLVEATRALARALLEGCPALHILATSREVCGVPGETVLPLEPFRTPTPGELREPEALATCDAVRLFIARAAEAWAGYTPASDDLARIGEICAAVDGIPLAIELAAARVRLLTLRQISERLGDSLRLLTSGARGASERQRTIRGAIAWSYDLLTEDERRCFEAVSVFPGSFGLAAAEAVAGPLLTEVADPLDALAGLTDKSMLQVDRTPEESRFRMLGVLRAYGRERLAERGEEARARDLHLEACAGLVEETLAAAAGQCTGARADRLEAEADNLRAALDWAVEQGRTERVLRLSGLLWPFWQTRGTLTEGRLRADRALAMAAAEEFPGLGAEVIRGAAALAFGQGDYPAAARLWHEHIALCERLGDRAGMAASIGNLGNHAYVTGDFGAALAHYEESIALMRDHPHRRGGVVYHHNLGQVLKRMGAKAGARTQYEQSLAVAREIGFAHAIPHILCCLGVASRNLGDLARAEDQFGEALREARQAGSRGSEGLILNQLALLALAAGDPDAAEDLARRSLAVREEQGDRRGIAGCGTTLAAIRRSVGDLDGARRAGREAIRTFAELGVRSDVFEELAGLALVELEGGDLPRALRLMGAARALGEELRLTLPPDREEAVGRGLERAREHLGAGVAEDHLAAGAAMTEAEALVYALGEG